MTASRTSEVAGLIKRRGETLGWLWLLGLVEVHPFPAGSLAAYVAARRAEFLSANLHWSGRTDVAGRVADLAEDYVRSNVARLHRQDGAA